MKKLGFTILEVIIVIAIMMLLSLVVLITVNPKKQIDRAIDSQKKSDLSTLQQSLDDYYNDNNAYPSADDICYDSVNIDNNNCFCHVCGNETRSSLLPYLQKLPCDPQRIDYLYRYDCGDRQNYIVCGQLNENKINNQYNFGVSSTNISNDICSEYTYDNPAPSLIISTITPTSSPTNIPTSQPTPTLSTTPTPTPTRNPLTPTPPDCPLNNIYCRAGIYCNICGTYSNCQLNCSPYILYSDYNCSTLCQ